MKYIPHILTISRIILIPIIYYYASLDTKYGYILATTLFSIASMTDFFDGWIARKFNLESNIGYIMDQIADKIMIISILCILIEHDAIQNINLLAVFIIVARELIVSGIREYASMINIILYSRKLSKIKTVIQMLSLGFLLSGNAIFPPPINSELIGIILLWTATILTLITGINYYMSAKNELKNS